MQRSSLKTWINMTFTLKLVFYLLIVCVPTKMHSSLEAYRSDADSAFKDINAPNAYDTEIIIAREMSSIKDNTNIWYTVRKYANNEYTIETINTFPFTINIAKNNKCVGQFDLNEKEISSIINHCFAKQFMLYKEDDEEYYSIENNIITCFTKKNNAINNIISLEMRKQQSTCTTYLIPCFNRSLYGTFTQYTDENNSHIIIQDTHARWKTYEPPQKVKINIGTNNRVTYISISPIYHVCKNELIIFSEVKSNHNKNIAKVPQQDTKIKADQSFQSGESKKKSVEQDELSYIYTLDMYLIRCDERAEGNITGATHDRRLIFESDKKWTLLAIDEDYYCSFISTDKKNVEEFYHFPLGAILDNIIQKNIGQADEKLPYLVTKILYYSSLETKDIIQDPTITDEFLKETLNELTLDSTVTESDKQYKKIALSCMNPEKYSLTHFYGPSHNMYNFEALQKNNLDAILQKFTEEHDVLTMDRIKNICATVNQIMDLLIPSDKKNTTLQELDTYFLSTINALINAKDVATFSTHKQSFIDKIGHFYIDSLKAPLLKLLQTPDGFFISPNDAQESEALDELHDYVTTQNNTIKECIAQFNILTKPIFKANNQATNNELHHAILSNISDFLYAYYKEEDNFVTFEMSIQHFIDQNSNNIELLIKLEDLLLTTSDINNVHERAHKIHKITHTLEFLKKHATILSQYYLPPTSSAILRLSLESLTFIIGYLLFSYLNKGHIILGALPATLLLIKRLLKWKHILNEFNLSRQCKKFSNSVDNLDKILKKTCAQYPHNNL